VARLVLMAVIFVAALLFLSWVRWGLPLLARANRPFARAYRDLGRLKRRSFDESVYRQALRRLHGAFNETAGRALFSEQLQAFYASHPRYGGLEQSIDQLFAESRSIFFATGRATPVEGSDLSRLVGLCRECRERERRRA
jgi:mxaA protein